MTLRVVPEGLAAAAAAVEALTARLSAAEAGATAITSSVVPPAADPVSIMAATGLSACGAQHAAIANLGVAELGRSGVGVGETAVSYATGDAQAAATYIISSG